MRRSTLRRAVGSALVDATSGRVPRLPDVPTAPAELVTAARFHRVAPLVAASLPDGLGAVSEPLRDDRQQAAWHHLRVLATLPRIARALADVEWLTFKGPVLSETLHPVPGTRSYRDLDVLVAAGDLRRSCERLLDAGFRVVASRDDLLNGEVTGEIEMINEHGVLVDLHWSLVLSASLRRRYPIPTAELIGRSVPVRLGQSEVRTFDATDTLLHLCHHAARSGAARLIHLVDVDQAARRVIDWDTVTQRAGSWGTAPEVALVLGRCRRTLDTPAPVGLRHALGLSAAYGALTASVDRAWPIPSVRRDASWPRLVARAAHPGAAATLAESARNAVLGGVNRARLPEPTQARRVPATADEVERYLTAVEVGAAGRR
ncbi:nucleotidyltransferase family protein [Nocardioides sp. YIM 152588]|uniref:nucleotidyltransferase domain-containing protein n=1 Tax=Nocardioides sp. YIM 152588 TaxID=3158259 RepID=UPI0032E3DA80